VNLSIIKPGDIIGVADDSWLSHAIRNATGGGPVSHIQIVTATAPFVQVTEALDHVIVNPHTLRLAQCTAAYLMSPLNVSDFQRAQAVAIALSYVADRYGYGDIVLQAMDSLTQSRFWTDHFAEKEEPICSMLAALAWPCLHLDVKSETPNDFYYLAKAHPEAWRLEQLK
jgi:hypothetical protein